jgi:hypothetical protein
MLEGEDRQLEAFANLLSNWKLAASLKNRDWRTFSLRYNGQMILRMAMTRDSRRPLKSFPASLHAP